MKRIRVAIELFFCFTPVTVLLCMLFATAVGLIRGNLTKPVFAVAILATGAVGLVTGWTTGLRYVSLGQWPQKFSAWMRIGFLLGIAAPVLITIEMVRQSGSMIEFSIGKIIFLLICWLPVLVIGDWHYMQHKQRRVSNHGLSGTEE